MPIDISNETLVTLTEATHHLPPRRKGKRPAVSTLFRWAQRGIRGVRLETLQVGGTKCTSLEALQRFFDRLTRGEDSASQPTLSPSRQRRASEQAERELQRLGV
jgi:hypothetical protein